MQMQVPIPVSELRPHVAGAPSFLWHCSYWVHVPRSLLDKRESLVPKAEDHINLRLPTSKWPRGSQRNDLKSKKRSQIHSCKYGLQCLTHSLPLPPWVALMPAFLAGGSVLHPVAAIRGYSIHFSSQLWGKLHMLLKWKNVRGHVSLFPSVEDAMPRWGTISVAS